MLIISVLDGQYRDMNFYELKLNEFFNVDNFLE